jgi:hypothetical protein
VVGFTLGLGSIFIPLFKWNSEFSYSGNLYIFDLLRGKIIWGEPIDFKYSYKDYGLQGTENVRNAIIPFALKNVSVVIATKFSKALYYLH